MIKEFLVLVLSIIFIHSILMKIFSATTYHSYFFKSSPILLGYSVLTGWVVFELIAPGFMLWFFSIEASLLAIGFVVMRKGAKTVLGSNESSHELKMSINLTSAFYALSAIIFLVLSFVSYLYFYNS